MPIYEYACKGCGKHMEIIQKFSDAPLTQCPTCGGQTERLISSSAFVLKGGGWYKDGYSSKKSSESSTADTTTSDTKSGDSAPTCEKTGKPADAACACATTAKDK